MFYALRPVVPDDFAQVKLAESLDWGIDAECNAILPDEKKYLQEKLIRHMLFS